MYGCVRAFSKRKHREPQKLEEIFGRATNRCLPWLYLRLDMQSQSLIWWQGHICHPNIDAISAETNVLNLIPTCNVCSNMTWQKRRSSFALQRRNGSAAATAERRHNQIPVLQVLDVSFTKGPSVTVLNKWALIQRRGDKPHHKWNLGRGKTESE